MKTCFGLSCSARNMAPRWLAPVPEMVCTETALDLEEISGPKTSSLARSRKVVDPMIGKYS